MFWGNRAAPQVTISPPLVSNRRRCEPQHTEMTDVILFAIAHVDKIDSDGAQHGILGG
jgi:hypothetical protein